VASLGVSFNQFPKERKETNSSKKCVKLVEVPPNFFSQILPIPLGNKIPFQSFFNVPLKKKDKQLLPEV